MRLVSALTLVDVGVFVPVVLVRANLVGERWVERLGRPLVLKGGREGASRAPLLLVRHFSLC